MMPDDNDGGASLSDASGPLNALEADRFCEELKTFDFAVMGNRNWLQQHEMIVKLNLQAHVNASQQRDEFVLEAMVLHEKMPLIIRELIASELWKQNAFPLIRDWLDKNNSVKGYLLLYHEGVLVNLLEALLYHKAGCDAAGDAIIELVDYCHRKLMFLLNVEPPAPIAKDTEAFKKQLLSETAEDHSKEQQNQINLNCAMAAVSIMRFLTDHLEVLPLAVTARVLDTYDMLMVLCPLLEAKPWEVEDPNTGDVRRFQNGHWQKVPAGDVRKMHKCEVQCWLAVYNLMQDKEVRKRYQFNTFRKNTVLRVRKFLHETTVDQIPILCDLQRTLDEMLMQEIPPSAEARPAYLLEQQPEMRQHLAKDIDWKAVVAAQKAEALNDSEEEKRQQAAELAGLFDMDGMDELLQKEMPQAGDAPEFYYYTQLKVITDEGQTALSLTAQSEGTELTQQGAYKIDNDDKQRLIPASCNGRAVVTALLDGGSGKPWEVTGRLQLLEKKKKQWLQLGFDPYGMRVQLHVLAEQDGSGFHLIHVRVTPPPPCVLKLTFTPRKANQATAVVRAKGRGVSAQTPFEVEAGSAGVRVPKLCSAVATLTVGEAEEAEECTCEPADLTLAGASQMVWRQLGVQATELRVQAKLAPAAEGGFMLTAIRVTAPASFRAHGAEKNTNGAQAAAKAAAKADADAATKKRVVAKFDGGDDEDDAAPAAAPTKAAAVAPPKKENVPPPKQQQSKPTDWTKVDDDDDRIVEIEPEAIQEVVKEVKEGKPFAGNALPHPANKGVAADVDFLQVAAFGGAKEGFVFKKGSQGLGYYRDSVHRVAAASRKVGFAAEEPAAASDAAVRDAPSLEMTEAKKGADALFAAGDAAGAAGAYTAILEKASPTTALGHSVLSNRSACHLLLEEWGKCAADCDEALQVAAKDLPDQKRIKLYLRRAEARLALGLREMASADVHEADRLTDGKTDAPTMANVKGMKERVAAKKKVPPGPPAASAATTPAAAKPVPTPPAAPPAPAEPATTTPTVEVALSGEAPSRQLTLTVALPGVAKISELELEVSASEIAIHGGGFALKHALPFAIDDSQASAKFSSKAGSLRIKAPEASRGI